MPIDDFRRQVEVNLIGQVAVTQALLPLIRRARGRIVFISSIGGRIAFPLTGAYHAAKFGIEAVGDVFRQELRPWGISVSIVEPGSIATPIWERGERERRRDRRALAASARRSTARRSQRYRKAISETGRARRSRRRRSPRRSSTRSPRAARAPATWSASTPRSRRGPRSLIPTRVFDRIVARMMGL